MALSLRYYYIKKTKNLLLDFFSCSLSLRGCSNNYLHIIRHLTIILREVVVFVAVLVAVVVAVIVIVVKNPINGK